MNRETEYQISENGNTFSSTITNGLSSKNTFLFDGRCFCEPVADNRQCHGYTRLKLKQVELSINNITGEIEHKKPFYIPLFIIKKRINNAISNFFEFFNDKTVVNKRRITISGFTTKGLKRLFPY